MVDEAGAKPARRGRARQGKPVARHLPRDEEILRIAANVFVARGFEATKLEDIAREAGIAKASLYHYFSSKEDLMQRLIAAVFEQVEVRDEFAEGAGPAERLATIVSRRVQVVASYPVESAMVVLQLRSTHGTLAEEVDRYRRSNSELVADTVREGQAQGVFADEDPVLIARFVLGAISALSGWLTPDLTLDPTRIVEEATAYVLRGVGVDAVHARQLAHEAAEARAHEQRVTLWGDIGRNR